MKKLVIGLCCALLVSGSALGMKKGPSGKIDISQMADSQLRKLLQHRRILHNVETIMRRLDDMEVEERATDGGEG